jgi:hypothetical protein
MKKILINYSNNSHYNSQINNSKSGKEIGGFDEVISYNFDKLDTDFVIKNKHILSQHRGAGYWMWKPHIILKTLSSVDDGDIVFYCDSGITFIRPIDELIHILDETQEKLLLFELDNIHQNKRWTKRDCFHYIGLDSEPYLSQSQLLASYIIMRKNKFVVDFMNEWLKFSEDYRIITDSTNECGLPNYEEFVDHRHDQSILSLLGRKYNINNIPDISQFGIGRMVTNQILDHHRSRN